MLKFHASETVCPAMTEKNDEISTCTCISLYANAIYNIRLEKKISFILIELITGTLYTLHILFIIKICHFSNHDLVLVAELLIIMFSVLLIFYPNNKINKYFWMDLY